MFVLPGRSSSLQYTMCGVAERARQLAPGLSEVQIVEGDYYYQGKLDYVKALEAYSRAARDRPNDPRC